MPCKSNQKCCNGDCNQGRECPEQPDGTVQGFAPVAIAFLVVMLTLMTIRSCAS